MQRANPTPPAAARTCAVLLAMALAVAAAPPPNIVHIIADDLGWNDVGFHGSEILTPNIDRLAAGSVILDRFYVAPVCSPTRAGLLTGRYPVRFGMWGGVISPTVRSGLPPAETTVPELLAGAGYAQRGMFGKWHLGHASTRFHPLNHGFTRFYGHYNGAIDYFSRKRAGQLDWHLDFASVHEQGYSTDLLGAAAIRFIREMKSRPPFYLVLAFNAPHSPLQAKPEDLARYDFDPSGKIAPNTDAGIARRENAPDYGERGRGNSARQVFAAMTTAMDRQIGALLAALDEEQLADNTLLVFHSDNGGTPVHGGSNRPLRGGKFTTWEGGVRVVAMIRWPARFKGGRSFAEPTAYIDLLPTFAAAANIAPASRPACDGIDLLPALTRAEALPERSILLADNAAVSRRWKLTAGQLFDILADPNETRDLAADHPDVLARLQQDAKAFANMRGAAHFTTLPKPASWPPAEWQLPDEKN